MGGKTRYILVDTVSRRAYICGDRVVVSNIMGIDRGYLDYRFLRKKFIYVVHGRWEVYRVHREIGSGKGGLRTGGFGYSGVTVKDNISEVPSVGYDGLYGGRE
uniref:Uncharacterized protein n=1 Tax=viral metagenome TaxID=1070528 RepID=A0A6M3MIG3_9ZZZZ